MASTPRPQRDDVGSTGSCSWGRRRVLLFLFFLAPVHRRHRHRLHRHGPQSQGHQFTTENVAADARRRPPAVERHGDDAHLCPLHAGDLQRQLRAAARAAHDGAAGAGRRLLPRGLAPAADEPVGGLCAAVDLGGGADRLRAPQPGAAGLGLPLARHEERRADAARRAGQRLHRRLVRHDHLHQRHPLDPASISSMRPGSTAPAGSPSSATSRCRRSAGSSAS